MAADEVHYTPPSTDTPSAAPGGSAGRARKILAVMALAWLGLYVASTMVLVVANGPEAGLSLFRDAVVSLLRLPLVCIVPLVALNSLLTAEIIVEMLRFRGFRSRPWSDKRHFLTVLVIWIVLFGGQFLFALAAHRQLLEG